MTSREFEENWTIQQAVIRISNDRTNAEHDANIRRAIRLEDRAEDHAMISAPFDPATATPEQTEQWIRQMSS